MYRLAARGTRVPSSRLVLSRPLPRTMATEPPASGPAAANTAPTAAAATPVTAEKPAADRTATEPAASAETNNNSENNNNASDSDNTSTGSSGLRRVAYSALFLAAVGVAGTLYTASHDQTFRGQLKDAAPILPWDALAGVTQTAAESVVAVAKKAELAAVEKVKEVVAPTKIEVVDSAPPAPASAAVPIAATVVAPAPTATGATDDQQKQPQKQKQATKKSQPAPEPAATVAAPAAAAAETAKKVPAPVVLPPDTPVEEVYASPAANSLHHSLHRLSALFRALATTSPEIRPTLSALTSVLASAEQDLQSLATQLSLLSDEAQTLVSAALQAQAAELGKALDAHDARLRDESAAAVALARDQGTAAVAAAEDRAREAAAVRDSQWAQELGRSLAAQESDLEAQWRREVGDRLDHERRGRLAKLDHLALKLKYLERVALASVERLHTSYHVHALSAALTALHATLFEDAVVGAGAAPRSPPFARQWALLHKLAGDNDLMKASLLTVSESTAHRGVASLPELHLRFANAVAPEVRRTELLPFPDEGENDRIERPSLAALVATMLPESARDTVAPVVTALSPAAGTDARDVPPVGFISYGLAKALAAVMVAKTPANYPDNGVESRLARIEWHLQREDLDSAAREVNQLNGWSRRVARDWLEEARRHLEVRMAVEVMQAQVAMMGLGAV